MSSAAPLPSFQPRSNHARAMATTLAILLTAWLALVILLAANNAFVGPIGSPPLPIAIAFAGPLILFVAALRLSPSFHEFVLTLDLRLLVAIQAWRFTGLGFLALYAYNVLPGSFALPAGLGDMAIAVTAPAVLIALIHRPNFASTATFKVWNALGILDLLAAIGSGALNATFATALPGEINTTPMSQLPLVLIPAFLVPIFLMLHVASLMQSRRATRDLKAPRIGNPEVTRLPGHLST